MMLSPGNSKKQHTIRYTHNPVHGTRCSEKIAGSEHHDDFPVMIAEALDALDAKEFDVRKSAAALGCSTSQLVCFIASVPAALAVVNTQRLACSLHRLLS